MNVAATSKSSSTGQTDSSTGQVMSDMFMKLLVAQLKGQNPLDPKDGAEFVTQLAQFSSLEELINIRTTLEGMSKSSTTATNSSNPFKGA